jgi:hypothetical protein
MLMMMSNPSESNIKRGKEAELSILRAAFQANQEAARAALDQFLDEPDERILHPAILVSNRQQTTNGDDEGISDQVTCLGTLVVTSDRVIFWSDDDGTGDLIVPAKCVDLHAMSSARGGDEDTDEPEETRTSLYLQIRSDCERSSGDLIEWTLLPHGLATQEDHERTTQTMFDALSELISLHPIDPDENMDDDGDDETVVAPPGHYGDDAEATPEERRAMLDRLDRLLVVPPELEETDAVEGQFDNAEDDDDDEGRFDDADEDAVDALL